MRQLLRYAKYKNPFALLEAYLEVLEKYIELKKVEKIENTKRLKLEKDIKLIKEHTQKKKELINKIFLNKLEEREIFLKSLLGVIDKNIENPQLLNSFLKLFTTTIKSPLISDKELEALAELTINNILEDDSILEKEIIEI